MHSGCHQAAKKICFLQYLSTKALLHGAVWEGLRSMAAMLTTEQTESYVLLFLSVLRVEAK